MSFNIQAVRVTAVTVTTGLFIIINGNTDNGLNMEYKLGN